MSVPNREADENRIFRALTVVVCDLQAKCPLIVKQAGLQSSMQRAILKQYPV